ncbi:MAG TPA: hypothetical protein VHN77_13355 [Phycisphaerales bacterium]|nr:hypothetical protein [Phycisphaerales bacterium]
MASKVRSDLDNLIAELLDEGTDVTLFSLCAVEVERPVVRLTRVTERDHQPRLCAHPLREAMTQTRSDLGAADWIEPRFGGVFHHLKLDHVF